MFSQNKYGFGGLGNPGVASLGVPPGVLSGVSTATTPVQVSQLGPPAPRAAPSVAQISPPQVAMLNNLFDVLAKAHGGTSIGPGGIGSDANFGMAQSQAPQSPAQQQQNNVISHVMALLAPGVAQAAPTQAQQQTQRYAQSQAQGTPAAQAAQTQALRGNTPATAGRSKKS